MTNVPSLAGMMAVLAVACTVSERYVDVDQPDAKSDISGGGANGSMGGASAAGGAPAGGTGGAAGMWGGAAGAAGAAGVAGAAGTAAGGSSTGGASGGGGSGSGARPGSAGFGGSSSGGAAGFGGTQPEGGGGAPMNDASVDAISDVATCPPPDVVAEGSPCSAPEETCNGVCTTTQTDPMNCNLCGNICAAYQGCNAGVCVCSLPAQNCFGQCTDLGTDPANCGACGQPASLGAACRAGMPTDAAEKLVETTINFNSFTADTSNVYWQEGPFDLMARPLDALDGGLDAGGRTVVSAPGFVDSPVASAGWIAWARGSDVFGVSTSGGTPLLYSSNGSSRSRAPLAVDSSYVYWIEQSNLLIRGKRDGTEKLALVAANTYDSQFCLTTDYVFVTSPFVRVLKTGMGSTPLAQYEVTAIACDGAHAFFLGTDRTRCAGEGDGLFVIGKTDTSATLLAKLQFQPPATTGSAPRPGVVAHFVATDGIHVVYAESPPVKAATAYTLMSIGVTGGASRAVGSETADNQLLAVFVPSRLIFHARTMQTSNALVMVSP